MRYADNAKVVISQAITNADVNSEEIDLSQHYIYAAHAIWTDGASLVGTVKLQATIDGINWVDIEDSEQTATGSGSWMWNDTIAAYKKVRGVFDWTSGTGSVKWLFSTKGP